MKRKLIIATLIALLFTNQSTASNIYRKTESTAFDKLYIHTDREMYFTNDSIWFKAYYLNAQTNELIQKKNNLYIDLFDKEGKSIQNQIKLIERGVSRGYIKLPTDIKQGNYLIRAYTDAQKTFGEDTFFYKSINISENKGSEETNDVSKQQSSTTDSIDIMFFPEGGMLLEGVENILAFKALNSKGQSVNTKGKILDRENNTVASFETKYNGMGTLRFIPQKEKTYKVYCDHKLSEKSQFPNIVQNSVKISLMPETPTMLPLKILTNKQSLIGESFYLACLNKGTVLYDKLISIKDSENIVMIKKEVFQEGINRIVLLNKEFKPLSERLYFSNTVYINNIKIESDQDKYDTRSPINLTVFDDKSLNDHTFSDLSLSIVNKNAIGLYGANLNIVSYLYLSSELKGHIEQPIDFFIDEKNINSKEKLDLLMLTQGWSSYIWNKIPNITPPNYKSTSGLFLKGKVKHDSRDKLISYKDVFVGIFKNNTLINNYSTTTDSLGNFFIDKMYFTEEATAFIQTQTNKKYSSTITKIFPQHYLRLDLPIEYLNADWSFNTFSMEMHRQKYFNDLALKEFIAKEGSITLKEVTIKGRKTEKDEHKNVKIHGNVFHEFKPDETDIGYIDLKHFLLSNVKGLWPDPVYYLTYNGYMLRYFLNGTRVYPSDIYFLSPDVIDKVELLNRAERIMYGPKRRGADAVLAIYTKRGNYSDGPKKDAKDSIIETIRGYEPFKEFYSPSYTHENIESPKPDYRTTLYWNPDIITEETETTVSFFSSDELANYIVILEGVTSNGTICLGKAEFSVNNYNPKRSNKESD